MKRNDQIVNESSRHKNRPIRKRRLFLSNRLLKVLGLLQYLLYLKVLGSKIFNDLLVRLSWLRNRRAETVEYPFDRELLHLELMWVTPWTITCAADVVRTTTRLSLFVFYELVALTGTCATYDR